MSDENISCKSKIKYSNAVQARLAAKRCKPKKGLNVLEAYKCRHCDGWHIGNRRPKTTKNVTKFKKRMSYGYR